MMAPHQAAVLLSVRSPHVERLLDGSKTVEVRRRPWRVPPGTTALLYRSGTRRAIVGSVVVDSTEVGTPAAIWSSHGERSGLTKDEYSGYLVGAQVAVAILVRQPRLLDEPLSLEELRRRNPAFHVPHSYRFMRSAEIHLTLNGERSALMPDLAVQHGP